MGRETRGGHIHNGTNKVHARGITELQVRVDRILFIDVFHNIQVEYCIMIFYLSRSKSSERIPKTRNCFPRSRVEESDIGPGEESPRELGNCQTSGTKIGRCQAGSFPVEEQTDTQGEEPRR